MENLQLKRTTSQDEDFKYLVKFLDAELAERDGDAHTFYHQFNGISMLNNCVIAYLEGNPVGIGAIKKYSEDTVEVKRMFVEKGFRGMGIASKILMALENWTSELNFNYCVLETGVNQPEAIALYKKSGYEIIENYGQYKDISTSICFQKKLSLL